MVYLYWVDKESILPLEVDKTPLRRGTDGKNN